MEYIDKNKYLKELQEYELDILKYFDKICKDNNLEYFLAYGSLIGAMRHKGFIPWDDDVDVCMKSSDYLKLCEILKENKDDKYFFQSIETDKNYYLFWNKIRLNNTIFVEKGWEKNDVHQGIFIDIFPLLDYPDEKDKKKIDRKFLITKLLLACNLKDNKFYNSYGKAGKLLFKLFKIIPQFIRNKIANNNINYLCKYNSNSKYYYVTDEGTKYKYNKEWFDETITLPFEKYNFLCPKESDKFLRSYYGDYMKLPPQEERVGHGECILCFDIKGDHDDKKGKNC